MVSEVSLVHTVLHHVPILHIRTCQGLRGSEHKRSLTRLELRSFSAVPPRAQSGQVTNPAKTSDPWFALPSGSCSLWCDEGNMAGRTVSQIPEAKTDRTNL